MHYNPVLISELDLQYLWLLNREVNLDEATKQQYLNYAEILSYDLSALIHTVHTRHKTA
ncbi:lipocalin family protein [Acinetobacter terrae]|jgi:apolipoprotein D and lipocalin family protein|uniref:lipocalin family protein n=1 Tax=Acinetobacter terrae TaxID=2731247 RepID=UPI000B2997C2|nr:lipocalin family protein [Acinetobacter terrae]